MAVHFSRVKGDSAGGVIAGPSVPAVQKYPVGKLQIIGRPPRGDMVHTSIRHHALPRPPRLPPLTHTPCPDVVRRFILRVICSALLHEGGWRKTRFFFYTAVTLLIEFRSSTFYSLFILAKNATMGKTISPRCTILSYPAVHRCRWNLHVIYAFVDDRACGGGRRRNSTSLTGSTRTYYTTTIFRKFDSFSGTEAGAKLKKKSFWAVGDHMKTKGHKVEYKFPEQHLFGMVKYWPSKGWKNVSIASLTSALRIVLKL